MALVKTAEILEALHIPSEPMSPDTMFEMEKAIEERWLKQFEEMRETLQQTYEQRAVFDVAKGRVFDAFVSVLHNKNVVVPSLYNAVAVAAGIRSPEPDETVVEELVQLAITYATMGRDFEIIIQAIHDNPMLMSEWERFMLSLRMAQED